MTKGSVDLAHAERLSRIESIRHVLRTTKLRAPLDWYRHRGLRRNDVFLASFHRSGNTWMRFVLCEILTQDGADFKKVGFAVPDLHYLRKGFPVLEGGGRLIKIHERYHKEYKKAIYFVRDPRDVVVSCYEFYRTGQSFDDFLDSWLRGKTSAHGTWKGHVRGWLHSPLVESGNLLVVRYEDMRFDIEGTVTNILRFLGVSADRETIRRAIANNTVEKMRVKEDWARSTGEGFAGRPILSRGRRIRNGSVGAWQERLTPAQVDLIEDHAGELLTRFGYESQRASVGEMVHLRESDRTSVNSDSGLEGGKALA